MYEEDDMLDEDDELEDIIEEAGEEESENDSVGPSSKAPRRKKKKEELSLRVTQKDELKTIKSQILSMQQEISQKANKIEEIKLILK